MKATKKVRAPGIVPIACLLSACMTGTSDPALTAGPGTPGLGSNLDSPTGSALLLPDTVTIQRVTGADHTDASFAQPVCGQDAERAAGNEGPGMVDVCITLRNDTLPGEKPSSVTEVTLPAGIIFEAKPGTDPAVPKSQNGLLAQAVTLSVPEGMNKTFALRLFCTNKTFPPSDRPAFTGDIQYNWEYETTAIQSDYAPLSEVITILRDKLITWPNAYTVQIAVWDVTEGQGGLTEANRANLQGLPLK